MFDFCDCDPPKIVLLMKLFCFKEIFERRRNTAPKFEGVKIIVESSQIRLVLTINHSFLILNEKDSVMVVVRFGLRSSFYVRPSSEKKLVYNFVCFSNKLHYSNSSFSKTFL